VTEEEFARQVYPIARTVACLSASITNFAVPSADLMQAAMIAALLLFRKYGEEPPPKLVTTAMRCEIQDHIRMETKRGRYRPVPLLIGDMDPPVLPNYDNAIDTRREIARRLNLCTERERAVLLAVAEGRSHVSIARELGVTASRITQIRTGALGRIRDAQRTPDAPSPTG
jgi:DNA-directed RNA polymerase specialized sigma24 family protein